MPPNPPICAGMCSLCVLCLVFAFTLRFIFYSELKLMALISFFSQCEGSTEISVSTIIEVYIEVWMLGSDVFRVMRHFYETLILGIQTLFRMEEGVEGGGVSCTF